MREKKERKKMDSRGLKGRRKQGGHLRGIEEKAGRVLKAFRYPRMGSPWNYEDRF